MCYAAACCADFSCRLRVGITKHLTERVGSHSRLGATGQILFVDICQEFYCLLDYAIDVVLPSYCKSGSVAFSKATRIHISTLIGNTLVSSIISSSKTNSLLTMIHERHCLIGKTRGAIRSGCTYMDRGYCSGEVEALSKLESNNLLRYSCITANKQLNMTSPLDRILCGYQTYLRGLIGLERANTNEPCLGSLELSQEACIEGTGCIGTCVSS